LKDISHKQSFIIFFAADCSKYYVCVDEEVVKEAQCSDGHLFDPVKKNCKLDDGVSCRSELSITLLRIL